MNDVRYTLDVKAAATGAGNPQDVAGVRDKYVQLTGTFVATLSIEGTIDGTTWASLVTGLNAPGITSVPHTVKLIRTNVTAWTSGQAAAVLAGFGVRDG